MGTTGGDWRIRASSGGEPDILNFYCTSYASTFHKGQSLPGGSVHAVGDTKAKTAPVKTASGFCKNEAVFVPGRDADDHLPDETPLLNLPGEKPRRLDKERRVKGSMAKTTFLPSVVLKGTEPTPARVKLEHSGFSHNAPRKLLSQPSLGSPHVPEKALQTLKYKDPVMAENDGKGPDNWSTTYRATVSKDKPLTLTPKANMAVTRLEENGYTRNQVPYVERPPSQSGDRTPAYQETFRQWLSPQMLLDQATQAKSVRMENSSYSMNNSAGAKGMGSKKLAKSMWLEPPPIHPSVVAKMKTKDPVEYKNLQQPNLMVSSYGCSFDRPLMDVPLKPKTFFGASRQGGSGYASNNPPPATTDLPLEVSKEEPDPIVQQRKLRAQLQQQQQQQLADKYADLQRVVMEHSGFTHGASRILKERKADMDTTRLHPTMQKLVHMRKSDGPQTRID